MLGHEAVRDLSHPVKRVPELGVLLLRLAEELCLTKSCRPLRERASVTVATEDIGNHVRDPQVVDIASAPQGGVFIACKCDVLNGRPAKAFAHVERDGMVDRTWRPARLDSASFGWEVLEAGGVTYLSAGGSDYVQAVDSLTGATLWKTDANGQVQTAALHGDRLVIGGHWRLVESYCQPRLAALDPMTGSVDRTWTPAQPGVCGGVGARVNHRWRPLGGRRVHVCWQRSGTQRTCMPVQERRSDQAAAREP